MSSTPFVSFAQNREDVLLHRALKGVSNGRYIDVGANDPSFESVTKAFYDLGWSGVLVEPNPEFVQRLRAERDRDTLFAGVAAAEANPDVVLHRIPGTGLSTMRDDISAAHLERGFSVDDLEVAALPLTQIVENSPLASGDIHFMTVDTEGFEAEVLQGMDFARFRPWIVAVEATAPLTTDQVHESWEPILLKAGYEFCVFDGLSRFYVAKEKREELGRVLSYPVCIFDGHISKRELDLKTALEATQQELAEAQKHSAELEQTLRQTGATVDAMRGTLSWKATTPLRWVRSRLK